MVIIMQQSVKKNKSFVNLEILIDVINDSYSSGKENELEKHIYNTLGLEEIATLVHLLEEQYGKRSILDDLYDSDKKNIIMYRILYNLSLRYYIKVADSSSGNDFFIKFFIEQYLLLIFNNLFTSHILSSKGMSKKYIDELNRIRKNINFKHTSDSEHRINYCMRYFLHHIDDELFKIKLHSYLGDLLDNILVFLSSLSDEQLEQDEIYAKAIIYQTLLRSILLIEHDLENIDIIKKKYLNSQNDSIAASIIRTAFIANFNDRELIVKMKTY